MHSLSKLGQILSFCITASSAYSCPVGTDEESLHVGSNWLVSVQ